MHDRVQHAVGIRTAGVLGLKPSARRGVDRNFAIRSSFPRQVREEGRENADDGIVFPPCPPPQNRPDWLDVSVHKGEILRWSEATNDSSGRTVCCRVWPFMEHTYFPGSGWPKPRTV